MSKRVRIKFKMPNWAKAIKSKTRQIYQLIASTIQTNRALLFDAEGAYHGHAKWAPLKFRDGMILSDRGTLRRSIGPMAGGDKPIRSKGSIIKYSGDIRQPVVIIGTSLAYAAIHDNGGVITPKKGKLLWIPLPNGKRANEYTKQIKKDASKGKWSGAPIVRYKGKTFLLAKKVTIPARPFGQKAWNQEDQNEVLEALKDYIEGVISDTPA